MLDRQGITGSIGKNWTGIGVTNQIGGLAERNKGEERGEGKRNTVETEYTHKLGSKGRWGADHA